MVTKAAGKSELAWFYLRGFDRLELRAIYLTVRRPPNLAAFYVAEIDWCAVDFRKFIQ
jgi:hypothetical protein